MSENDLQFVRVIDPNIFRVIPRKLFEQIKGYEFDIGKLIRYGASIATHPLTYMFVLTDAANKIQGILWSRVDVVDEMFEVYLFSVERKYQNSGILAQVLKFMRELQEQQRPILKKAFDINLKDKILLVTTKPKGYMKLGAVYSKRIILEISNVEPIKTEEPNNSG